MASAMRPSTCSGPLLRLKGAQSRAREKAPLPLQGVFYHLTGSRNGPSEEDEPCHAANSRNTCATP